MRKESTEVHECAQTLLDLSANTSLSSTDESTIITNCVMDENILLAKEVQDLCQQVILLSSNIDSQSSLTLSPANDLIHLIHDSDSKTRFYTGLPTYGVFKALVKYFEPKIIRARQWQGQQTKDEDVSIVGKKKLDVAGELLAVLMRLRLGLLLEDVADRCKVSVSTMSRMFTTWLRLLSTELQLLFPWPSRELVAQYTPYRKKIHRALKLNKRTRTKYCLPLCQQVLLPTVTSLITLRDVLM